MNQSNGSEQIVNKIDHGDFFVLELDSGQSIIVPSKQNATVVSAFPAVGKSYIFDKMKLEKEVYDSDSSTFDKSDFPNNYITHIRSLMLDGKKKLILVSSHEEVREELVKNNIRFYLIYPDASLKDEYMERYRSRGSDENFIKMMDEKFESFVESCDTMESDLISKIKITEPNTYLGDIIQ